MRARLFACCTIPKCQPRFAFTFNRTLQPVTDSLPLTSRHSADLALVVTSTHVDSRTWPTLIMPHAFRARNGQAMQRDFYADLGVTEGTTDAEIKRAYRELVLKVHPDKQGDAAEFRKVCLL